MSERGSWKAAVAVGLVAWGLAKAEEPLGKDVIAKSLEARSVSGFRVDAVVDVTEGGQARPRRELTWWRRTEPGGEIIRTVVLFRAPASLADEALLVVEKGGAPVEGWLFLPRLRKTRRLHGKLLAASLAEGPFAFLDVAMARDTGAKREHAGPAPCPGTQGAACHRVVVTGEAGCARREEWIDARSYLPVRVDCLGEDGGLARRMTLGDFQASDVKGRKVRWPRWIHVEEPAAGRTAKMELRAVASDEPAPASLFTPEGLPQAKSVR